MKIKGFFVIPLIAILVAMLTVGTVPGFASDTTATESATESTVYDSFTYIPTTPAPTSSFEEELGGFISDAFGDSLEQTGDDVRGISKLFSGLLTGIRDKLLGLIEVFKTIGDKLGNSGGLDGILGGIFG